MVITCLQCSARLQLDDTKVPSRAFTVRCPKCQHIINAQPPAAQPPAGAQGQGALGLGEVPSAQPSRFSRPAPAPVFRPDTPAGEASAPDTSRADPNDVAQLLASLLQRAMSTAATEASKGMAGGGWGEHRRALVCASTEQRFAVARVLVESGYEVYVADDTTQAIERMRTDRMDVVILDPGFDAVEQGAAFIRREISALRPAARRRLFFVLTAPDMRSGDPHQAFVNHANLVLNTADAEELPLLLDRTVRDFNELYRDFNRALQVADF